MKEIRAQEKSIRDLLGKKYSVDSYQREYKWVEKQIDELVDDLLAAFEEDYQDDHEQSNVETYGQYFLGPIIVSVSDNKRYIVDGQQRLTSLTLMLIRLLHMTNDEEDKTQLRTLIYSTSFGKKSFNLDVPEREPCLRKLYEGERFDVDGESESVRNLVARHGQLQEKLSELTQEKISLFIIWLTHKVILVEIETSSETDAYKIFETMNDRGLRLTPAEMLKGYLLTKIEDASLRERTNTEWKKQVDLLGERNGEDADLIKFWLRARHAQRTDDYEKIGSQFHRWVRDNSDSIGLKSSSDFEKIISRDFSFYAKQFMRLRSAAEKLDVGSGLECVHYLAQRNFTLQYPLLLAPLSPNNSPDDISQKLRVVAAYLDILIHRKTGNWKRIAESTMRHQIFPLISEVRNLTAIEIADFLATRLENSPTLAPDFGLHGQNRRGIKCILARITDYLEKESGNSPGYEKYFTSGKAGFQIEHIWHNNYKKVCREEKIKVADLSENDFNTVRNNIGGLLLLPRKDNSSYGAKPYAKKRKYYLTQNLLAGSLHKDCYEAKPGLRQFAEKSGLPFESHTKFDKADLEKRQEFYRKIADRIWHPDRLHEAAKS